MESIGNLIFIIAIFFGINLFLLILIPIFGYKIYRCVDRIDVNLADMFDLFLDKKKDLEEQKQSGTNNLKGDD